MIIEDARVRELAFLTKLELAGGEIEYDHKVTPEEGRMVLRLFEESLLNDIGHYADSSFPYYQAVEHATSRRKMDLGRLLTQEPPLKLRIGHRGMVRRAELEEALRTGRDRDPTGLAVARRYFERDLAVALLRASTMTPVTLAVLDMNGLKAINDDAQSHATGDNAIRTYLQVIVSHLKDGWDAYRGEGGDEVAVIMRGATAEVVIERMKEVLLQLQREFVMVGDSKRFLSAACGIAAVTDSGASPDEFVKRADSAQYRAKALSRSPGRPATLAAEDGEAQVISEESDRSPPGQAGAASGG